MIRYLVVGASGLIGQAFLRIVGPDLAIGTFRERPFSGGIRFDLVADRIENLLRGGNGRYTHALILGGIASIDVCARDPAGTAEVNVRGVARVIDAAVKQGITPIFASSDGVYDGSHGAWREDQPARPILTYGRQKLAVEQHLQGCGKRWLALRIAKVLDPGLSAQGVLGPWGRALIEGERLRCATDQRFTPLAVEDVVAAIRALADAGASGTFNLAGREDVSRFDLVKRLESALAERMAIHPAVEPCSIRDFAFAEPRPLDTTLSIAKLQAAIRFAPESLGLICERAASRLASARQV